MAGVASGNLIAAGATNSFSDPMGGPSVDLMTEISGPSFEEVWQSHQVREVNGVPVRIASLRHIVASKRAADRQDRYALKRLEEDLGQQLKESRAHYRVKKRRCMIRVFVAIELPEEVRAAVDEAQARLRRARLGVKVSWTKLTNLHLTLQFLGEVAEAQIAAIQAGSARWRRPRRRSRWPCVARGPSRADNGRGCCGWVARTKQGSSRDWPPRCRRLGPAGISTRAAGICGPSDAGAGPVPEAGRRVDKRRWIALKIPTSGGCASRRFTWCKANCIPKAQFTQTYRCIRWPGRSAPADGNAPKGGQKTMPPKVETKEKEAAKAIRA